MMIVSLIQATSPQRYRKVTEPHSVISHSQMLLFTSILFVLAHVKMLHVANVPIVIYLSEQSRVLLFLSFSHNYSNMSGNTCLPS